jgi:hypothetical protein
MLLKTLTTLFIVVGVLLAFSFPWIVGPTPKLIHRTPAMARGELTPEQLSGLRAEKEYSVRFGIYVMSLLTCFIAASICALILARKVRLAYQEEARQNLEFLIESTLRTHQKQPPPTEKNEQDA